MPPYSPMDNFGKRVYTRTMITPCYCAMLRTAARKIGSVYDNALAALGINIAQYSLLRLIERRQPVSLTELGRVAQLDRSTVGRNVRVLERMGLVETGRGEDDHREAVVSLAVRGVEVLDEAAPLWEKCQREIEKRLGPVKVTALRDILRTI
jgi:DNA-binding MarR family transcriptional regulator